MKHVETFLDTYDDRVAEGEDGLALGLELLFLSILDLATTKDDTMEVATS